MTMRREKPHRQGVVVGVEESEGEEKKEEFSWKVTLAKVT